MESPVGSGFRIYRCRLVVGGSLFLYFVIILVVVFPYRSRLLVAGIPQLDGDHSIPIEMSPGFSFVFDLFHQKNVQHSRIVSCRFGQSIIVLSCFVLSCLFKINNRRVHSTHLLLLLAVLSFHRVPCVLEPRTMSVMAHHSRYKPWRPSLLNVHLRVLPS